MELRNLSLHSNSYPKGFTPKGVGDSATSEARALPLFVSSKVNQSSGENNRKPCY